MPTRVKICCIASVDEMQLAVRYGASAVGLVSSMPSGPGPIDDATIASITPHVPPGVASFLLTCCQDAVGVIDQQRRLRANTLQLVDQLPVDAYREIRASLPGVHIVQVIHVMDEEAIAEAELASYFADAILLDSGNPRLAVKELGGTGRRHDWSISRRIRETIDKPLWLAGGLNAENVREAIETVQPFGVDVCSGVRTGGKLDEAKLAAFMASAWT